MLRYPFLYEMIAKKQVKFYEFDLLFCYHFETIPKIV